jgi:choline monooxygenase
VSRAPLDTDPLRPIEDGWTLPAAWYADPGIVALERERIFSRAWQYAGRADQVEAVGSFFATEVAYVPIVVARGRDEVLRAFVNVCRHRGHPVASGEGCRETLQCPYHAWTYDLDGSLRRAPRADREPGFDPSGLSLRPVSVDTWGPFVFVNADPDAPPLEETLGELPDLVAASGVDLDTVRFHSHYEWDIKSNWKVAVENFLECYHCPTAHPGFSKVIDVSPDAYALTVAPSYSSQVGSVRPSALSGNGKAPYVPRGAVTQAQYHFLWPNTTISIEAGATNISIERWVPVHPGACIEVTDSFFGRDVSEAEAQEIIAFGTQVGLEDLALCESVQIGLDSRMVPQGKLMLASEPLIHDFQRKVAAALASMP